MLSIRSASEPVRALLAAIAHLRRTAVQRHQVTLGGLEQHLRAVLQREPHKLGHHITPKARTRTAGKPSRTSSRTDGRSTNPLGRRDNGPLSLHPGHSFRAARRRHHVHPPLWRHMRSGGECLARAGATESGCSGTFRSACRPPGCAARSGGLRALCPDERPVTQR